MTTLIIVGILLPVLLLGALCVWLAVRLQRAERELEVWRVWPRGRGMQCRGLHRNVTQVLKQLEIGND